MKNIKKDRLVFNNSGGYTLLGVLLIVVVFSILGVSLISLSFNSVKMSTGERDDQSAFYIAESGITESMYKIDEMSNKIYKDIRDYYERLPIEKKNTYNFKEQFYKKISEEIINSTTTLESFETNFENKPFAVVTLKRLSSAYPPQYRIESIGNIGSKRRTVTQDFSISLEDEKEDSNIPGNIAVYVNKTINLSGSATIHGNVGTRANNGSVKLTGGAKVTGEIFYDVPDFMGLPPFPNIPTYSIPPDRIFKESEWNKTDLIKDGKLLINNWMTNGYTLNMSEIGDKDGNVQFEEILLGSSNNLIINVGEKDREIVVKHLNVLNGHIQIIGKGTLTIYVKDTITMGSGSTINSNTKDVDKLKVFQKGDSEITLAGDQKIYGSLYAEKANITISGGGGFQGDIYTGGTEVNVNGGAGVISQLFLAPNAKFTLAEGGKIKGLIIADSFVGSGGVSVTYNELNGDIESGGSIPGKGEDGSFINRESLIEK